MLRSLVVVSVREGRRAVTTTPVIQSGRFETFKGAGFLQKNEDKIVIIWPFLRVTKLVIPERKRCQKDTNVGLSFMDRGTLPTTVRQLL